MKNSLIKSCRGDMADSIANNIIEKIEIENKACKKINSQIVLKVAHSAWWLLIGLNNNLLHEITHNKQGKRLLLFSSSRAIQKRR